MYSDGSFSVPLDQRIHIRLHAPLFLARPIIGRIALASRLGSGRDGEQSTWPHPG